MVIAENTEVVRAVKRTDVLDQAREEDNVFSIVAVIAVRLKGVNHWDKLAENV